MVICRIILSVKYKNWHSGKTEILNKSYMEITLGYGSYCKISSYQEGMESFVETLDTTAFYPYQYFENRQDEIDY